MYFKKRGLILIILIGLCALPAALLYCSESAASRDGRELVACYFVCDKNTPCCIEKKLAGRDEAIFLEPEAQLTIDDVASAEYYDPRASATGKESPKKLGIFKAKDVLTIKLTDEGKCKLFCLTSNNKNRRLAVVVDGTVIMAPVIKDPVDMGEIKIVDPVSPIPKEVIQSIVDRINKVREKQGRP